WLIDEAQISFIGESRCLKRMPRPFTTKLTTGQPAEFPIDQWHQFVHRRALSVRESHEQWRHVIRFGCHEVERNYIRLHLLGHAIEKSLSAVQFASKRFSVGN